MNWGKMDWNNYKQEVKTSRKIIIIPVLEKYLAGLGGTGIDIGCGDGDLTEHFAEKLCSKIVGIDLDKHSIESAQNRQNKNVHYVCGNIEENDIPNIGITFDFAFSNCCFTHISDQGVYRTLTDIRMCLRSGGIVVFLVPSLSWAKANYSSIVHDINGISAVPRYGGRQFFRLPEWYVTALERCGFASVKHEGIVIPDSEELDDRYRKNVGQILFDAFTACRVETVPNIEFLKEGFEIAQENRKLEIGLFWQRSLFFWGFVATSLAAFGAIYGKNHFLSSVLSLFGLVCSVMWTAGNRGSKYWQEFWEAKVNFYQHFTTGNIFFDRKPKRAAFWKNYAARRISVSKLTMALSDYMAILWFVLSIITVGRQLVEIPPLLIKYGATCLLV